FGRLVFHGANVGLCGRRRKKDIFCVANNERDCNRTGKQRRDAYVTSPTPNERAEMLETRIAGHRSASSTRRSCRTWLPLLASALLAAACGGNGAAKPDGGTDGGTDGAGEAGTPQKLLILHTNDIHSHLMGFAPEADYTPA